MNKFKHLTLDDRYQIQSLLNDNCSFRQIARELNRSVSTISDEVNFHASIRYIGAYGRSFNNCKIRHDCAFQKLCNKPDCNIKHCRNCNICFKHCKEYIEEQCSLLQKKKKICNGCNSKRKCTLAKREYNALTAHNDSQLYLKESRKGFNTTAEELAYINSIVTEGVNNGLSLTSIHAEYSDTIMVSIQTLYNYIDAGLIDVKNIDLISKVKYKVRKKKSKEFKVEKSCRIDRTYDDYLQFKETYPEYNIVHMDSVEGIKGGKVLLTLYFPISNLMLGFLRERNDAASVTNIFKDLLTKLGIDNFLDLFKIILTDNGSEFSNPTALEFITDSESTEKVINVFYCDPSNPGQKGALEHNHTLLRRIIPKYNSFDFLTQEKVDIIFNHINSYTRNKLNNKTPYSIFEKLYGKKLLNKLGIQKIDYADLNLTPNLLK